MCTYIYLHASSGILDRNISVCSMHDLFIIGFYLNQLGYFKQKRLKTR